MTLFYVLLLGASFFACVQILYFIFIYLRLVFYKNKKKNSSSSEPVSIVIAARNELENLKILLPILTHQNYPEYEIIIANDRSFDDTYDFLYYERGKDARIKIVNIKDTPEHISPKKYAITLGIRAAQYENILLTDADCVPTSNEWVTEMQNCFSDKTEIILGISPYKYQKGFLNFIIRYETFTTAIQYVCYALAGIAYMGVGRNLAYKKSLFLKNKGFHNHLEILGGDDDLFVGQNTTRKNTKICISPQSHIISYPKTTWKDWIIQKRRHLNVGKYYSLPKKILLGIQNISHSFFWLTTIAAIIMYVLLKFPEPNILIIVSAAVIGFRILFWNIVTSLSAKKISLPAKWYLFPFFDLLYTFYVLILGMFALFTKPEKWN
jgi:glycosyltransferase involved in cell wall biosynthesis